MEFIRTTRAILYAKGYGELRDICIGCFSTTEELEAFVLDAKNEISHNINDYYIKLIDNYERK